MIVVRVSTSGRLVDSKPCTACLDAMLRFGISKIVYSDSGGNITKRKIRDLIGETRYSKGFRLSFK